MDPNSQSSSASANGPPPKPWERTATSSSTVAPFKPPSHGRTSDVVEASGTSKPGEIVSTADKSVTINRNAIGRPLPTRPWEQNYGNSTYGGYGSTLNYSSGYGSGVSGSYSGVGGLYGGGMYSNTIGGYGGLYGSSGMYGGGIYNTGFGGPMGGYGLGGGGGGPYGDQDPNNPYGEPPSPPGFWISFLLRLTFSFSLGEEHAQLILFLAFCYYLLDYDVICKYFLFSNLFVILFMASWMNMHN